jgi:hypothetical protein
MLTAEEIIKLFDGPKKLADELDAPLTTVDSWRVVNFIPRWWRGPILAAAERLNISLSTADFPTSDQRVPRPKREAA